MTIAEEIRGVVDLISGYLMPHMATIKTTAATMVGLYFFWLFLIAVVFFSAVGMILKDMRAKRRKRAEMKRYFHHIFREGRE